MLPRDANAIELPEQWFCEMNLSDIHNKSCDDPEKDKFWYALRLKDGQATISHEGTIKTNTIRDNTDSALSNEENQKLAKKDIILQKLLTVTARDRATSIISKHYFHDALLADTKDAPITAVPQSSNELTSQETPSPRTVTTAVLGEGAIKVSHLAGQTYTPLPSVRKLSPERASTQESPQEVCSQSTTVTSGKESKPSRRGTPKKNCKSQSCEEKKEVEEPSLRALPSGKSNSEVIEILSDSDDDDNGAPLNLC